MLHLLRVAHSLLREKLKNSSRSSHWPFVRAAFLKSSPTCAACGGTKLLQVHHVRPFHLWPELELQHSNLIALCMGKEDCHLFIGHGRSFSRWNPEVREHAAQYLLSPSSRARIRIEAAARSES